MQKINSVEFFRFFFMLVICTWHFNMLPIFKHGYLAVEFFFILSGFFMYKSYVQREQSTLDFVVKKIKRFLPEFLIVLMITFAIKSLKNISFSNSFDENFFWIINLLDDSLFVFSTGVFTNGIINPSWYLSVLIWGGGWLYAMLRFNRGLALALLFPIIIVFYFTYINMHGNNFEIWETPEGLFLPLFRGMAEMSIGAYLYIFLSSKQSSFIDEYPVSANVLSLLCLMLFFVLLFLTKSMDLFAIILIPIFLIGILYSKGWLNKFFSHKIWSWLGGITYEMLIVHWCFVMAFRALINMFHIEDTMVLSFLLVLYLFLVVVFSFLLKKCYTKYL